eukprot:TRINITY_DN2331_c0_g2_i1.p1 TRINITY_DN2331_c0_g2~~TRINITY_DN2331_c0_g2_i1.p1  ORF type:complete len:262 (-),score=4.44 TRINITY_DN2331_c0_g2_i1:191-976(-)
MMTTMTRSGEHLTVGPVQFLFAISVAMRAWTVKPPRRIQRSLLNDAGAYIPPEEQIGLDGQPTIHLVRLARLSHVMAEFITPAAVIVVLVYWALLSAGADKSEVGLYSNTTLHGIGAAVTFIDMFLCRVPFHSWHAVYMISYILIYMIWAWIWFGASGEWVYFFLDWSSRVAAAYYFGLLIFFVIVYYVHFGLVVAREKLGRRFGRYYREITNEVDLEDLGDSTPKPVAASSSGNAVGPLDHRQEPSAPGTDSEDTPVPGN